MSGPVKRVNPTLESYSPKSKPEILIMAEYAAFASDTISYPYAGGEPPRTSNKIQNYHRIKPFENYFLFSAICSMGKALGSENYDYHFYANSVNRSQKSCGKCATSAMKS